MKKVKIHETEIDDLTVEEFNFEFTEQAKERILKEFEKWNPSFDHEISEENLIQIRKDLLEHFMFSLQMHADFFIKWIKDAPRMPEHIEDTKDLIKNLRNTKRYLKKLYNMTIFVPRITTVQNIMGRDVFVNMISAKQTVKLAREAEKPIEKLLVILDENLKDLMAEPKKTGKPSGDMNSRLVDIIAVLLLKKLNIKPTGYSEVGEGTRGGGLFFRLVKTVFEILEIDCKDPSRLVKSAAKNIKTLSEESPLLP